MGLFVYFYGVVGWEFWGGGGKAFYIEAGFIFGFLRSKGKKKKKNTLQLGLHTFCLQIMILLSGILLFVKRDHYPKEGVYKMNLSLSYLSHPTRDWENSGGQETGWRREG